MKQNNSAHRLCSILEKATEENDQQDTTAAIGTAMGVEDISDRCFMIDFFVLISDVERSILLLKNVPKRIDYINTIKELQNIFFSHNLRGKDWPSIRQNIKNRNLILVLDACANFIALEMPVGNLGENTLADYLSECENLLKQITESDLVNDLKIFLIVRLEEICSAIRHYSIGGSERLQAVVEANIGGIILRSAGISQKDREAPIFKKVFSFLLTVGSILGMVTDSQALLKSDSVPQFLLPPGK